MDIAGHQTHSENLDDLLDPDAFSVSNNDSEAEVSHSASDENLSDIIDPASQTVLDIGRPTPLYHQLKWKRLRANYNDQYLDIFNATHAVPLQHEQQEFTETQIGAVTWAADEKQKLFDAIDLYGRHDLPRLAHFVETKSQIEVQNYLTCLHSAHVDRQLFEKRTYNMSHADIPAAIEIGVECEQILEQAADALSAFQDQYDITYGHQHHDTDWLVDRSIARTLDATASESVASRSASSNSPSPETSKCHELFHLSNWLGLSEKFFMVPSAKFEHDDWNRLAEAGQRPALTTDAIQDFHDLTVSLTRRILQVVIFLAKSRIRDNTRTNFIPVRVITRADVAAAQDVLKLAPDSWDFWTFFARRNKHEVVLGSHSKGESRTELIPHDAVEAALSARKSIGRLRRLSVSTCGSSPAASKVDDEADLISTIESTGSSGLESEYESDVMTSDAGSDHEDGDMNAPDLPSIKNMPQNPPQSRKRRRHMLEDEQDEYMERLDQLARLREENDILQMLGGSSYTQLKVEEDSSSLGTRPKTMRKDRDELNHWSCLYQAEWEVFDDQPFTKVVQTTQHGGRKTDDAMPNE